MRRKGLQTSVCLLQKLEQEYFRLFVEREGQGSGDAGFESAGNGSTEEAPHAFVFVDVSDSMHHGRFLVMIVVVIRVLLRVGRRWRGMMRRLGGRSGMRMVVELFAISVMIKSMDL